MGCVYHINCFHLWREFLLSSRVRRSGLLVIVAMQPLFLIFGIQFAGLFKDPTFPICVVGWFIGGAVNLTRTIEYAVQAGWSLTVPFVGLLPLAGLGATESGVNCSVIGVIAITSALVSVASELAGAIFGLGGACFVGCVCATSQRTILSRAKAGHKCREGCHGHRLFLAEVSGEPFVTDVMLKCR